MTQQVILPKTGVGLETDCDELESETEERGSNVFYLEYSSLAVARYSSTVGNGVRCPTKHFSLSRCLVNLGISTVGRNCVDV
jgi:hypothetical protein